MLTFTETQLMAWLTPILWPFLRVLALFTSAPVLSMRSVPVRVKLALSFLVALAAQAVLPAAPAIVLDDPAAFGVVLQQVGVGITMGFAARIVFAAIEFAGELIGLQMGLNYAAFFDATSDSSATASARFFGIMASWLFIVINGHLLLTLAVIRSFQVFPVGQPPLAFLSTLQPQVWGAEVFRLGLWIALPVVAMLLFVNMVLGIVSRVAPQMQIFAIGFPVTLGVGLVGMTLTLPVMQAPFTLAIERMLAYFQ